MQFEMRDGCRIAFNMAGDGLALDRRMWVVIVACLLLFVTSADLYFQHCREAMRAPSTNDSSFNQTTSGSMAACPT